jgi:serine/threonine protein kinase
MEYADRGTLREYSKENFDNLSWNDKYSMAFQLACAILRLHDEGIIHRDLVIHMFTFYFYLITYY